MRSLSSEEILECIDLIKDSLKVGIDVKGIKEELYETYSDVEPMEIDEIIIYLKRLERMFLLVFSPY